MKDVTGALLRAGKWPLYVPVSWLDRVSGQPWHSGSITVHRALDEAVWRQAA